VRRKEMSWLRTGGKRDPYVAAPIPSDETLLGTWTGSGIRGIGVTGMKVVLTNKSLILAPLDLSGAIKLFELFSKFVKEIAVPLDIGKDILEQTGLQKVISIPLGDIRSATVGNGAQLFRPPTVLITMVDGSQYLIGILRSITSPNIDPRNTPVRDEFLKALQAAIVAIRP
jgi:hypothetical protein